MNKRPASANIADRFVRQRVKTSRQWSVAAPLNVSGVFQPETVCVTNHQLIPDRFWVLLRRAARDISRSSDFYDLTDGHFANDAILAPNVERDLFTGRVTITLMDDDSETEGGSDDGEESEYEPSTDGEEDEVALAWNDIELENEWREYYGME